MSLLLPQEGKDFELVPAGTHLGICYRVVDLGTQLNQKFNKAERKLMFGFELPHEKMTDDRPFTQHERFTLSSSPKSNLRPFLESWRGQPFSDEDFGKFDLGKLIGVPCLMGIIHNQSNGKVYANTSSIMRVTKGMEIPPLTNEKIYFSLNDFKQEVYDKLSEGIKALIAKSPEYQQIKGVHHEDIPAESNYGARPPLDDEIPF